MNKAYINHVAGTPITESSDQIKIKGHIGKWYVIDSYDWRGQKVFLLEHETYGDEVAGLFVDKDGNIILEEVWNGYSDLEEMGGEL